MGLDVRDGASEPVVFVLREVTVLDSIVELICLGRCVLVHDTRQHRAVVYRIVLPGIWLSGR